MENLLYRLNERPKGMAFWLATVQWFVFILASVVTVPIVVGHSFGLSPNQIALFTERSFFVCGLIGVLQALFGHRFAIIEGPAGMWWGVFVVLIQMTKDEHGSMHNLLQQLEFGLIIAGLVFIILGAFGWLGVIRKLFTPVVTGTFLVLLSLQIAKSIIDGIFGIGFRGRSTVSPEIILLSVILVGLNVLLMFKGPGILKSISVLVSLIFGWILYGLLGLVNPPSSNGWIFQLPTVFPFGPPAFHVGVVVTCALTAIILLSNLIASIQAFAEAAGEKTTDRAFNRGAIGTGLGTVLTGMFGIVGIVPLASSASLVSLTGIASRLPYLLGAGAVCVLGLFPVVGEWVATLPAPVGYAVLFTVFGQLLGFGLRDYQRLAMDQRDVFVISLSVITGVGIYFVPATAWANLPRMLSYIVDNGLIVGIALVLLFEHVVFKRRLVQ